MSLLRKKFDVAGAPILFGLFAVLFYCESRYELRKRVRNRYKRILTNSVVSVPSFALLRFAFLPAMIYMAKKGSVNRGFLRQLIAFLFLDYTNYLWHILNHKVPLLWRFHLVHHTDADLDITTAFRFHFGEMIGSIFYRGAATFLSGASPITVIVYEVAFEAATEFHHSNTKLPLEAEHLISKILVTPRMHGIHHSVNQRETDSNFSVIFSVWDRLHQTLNLGVKQDNVVIGAPGFDHSAELNAGSLLMLPFGKLSQRQT